MEVFNLTLNQMLTMFTFIATGFILKRCNLVSENISAGLSKLEIFVFLPALSFSNMSKNFTLSSFKENAAYPIYGLLIVLTAMAVAYPLSALFVRNSKKDSKLAYERNIYKYALTFGNYGFMGNYIVLGMLGDVMYFKYSLYQFFLGIVCNTWGIAILTPKGVSKSKAKNILKKIFSPTFIAILLGVACGLFNISKYIPEFIRTATANGGACMGPVAMLLAGIVMGKYDFRKLISIRKVYVATALRLIVIPAVICSVLKIIGAPQEIMMLSLIAFGTPLGLNTVVFPAAYGGNVKIGASMAFVSHILSVITIPIMYYIFTVLL